MVENKKSTNGKKVENKNSIRFHQETFQGILNQYLLMFKAEQRFQFRVNILLLIASAFLVGFFSIDITKQSIIQMISLVPIFFIFATSIYSILKGPSIWPGVGENKYREFEENQYINRVYRSLINQMFLLSVDGPDS